MSVFQIQLSQSTIANIIEVNPTFTTNYGTFLGNIFTDFGTLQLNASTNFSEFLDGLVYGSYYFPSATQAVVTTSYATFTLNGPNLLSQTEAVLSTHSGNVDLSQVNVQYASGGSTLNFTGNVTLTDSAGLITSSGTLTSSTWTFAPTAYQSVYGTSDSYSLKGNFAYSNGSIGAGTLNQILFTSNGSAGTSTINTTVAETPVGTGFSFAGTILSSYAAFPNGDYENETNLNIPANGVISLNPLPAGNNTITGTYYGDGMTISTTSGTNSIAAGNGLTNISATNSVDTVTFKSTASSYTITPETNGSWVISSSTTGEGPDNLTGVTFASFSNGLTLNLTNGDWSNGTEFVATSPVAGASSLANSAFVAITDTAANVASAIDYIEPLVTAGRVVSIKLIDGGVPSLQVTSAQAANDQAVIKDITGSFVLSITAPTGDATIAGIPSVANSVSLAGKGAQYSVMPTGDGSSFTLTGNGATDHISHLQALQYSDYTDIVASQTPVASGSVSSAQITELYGAMFGRTPDIAGLSFYENYAAANPTTGFLQYAAWFLASPEYANNTAHNYAQTVAGDEQFITDTYANLLHRTPSAAETAYYENNVIAPALAGLTAGSAAYKAASAAAHAQVVVYFSQSPEFLGDVQVTAQSPTNAQHWLVLI